MGWYLDDTHFSLQMPVPIDWSGLPRAHWWVPGLFYPWLSGKEGQDQLLMSGVDMARQRALKGGEMRVEVQGWGTWLLGHWLCDPR